MADPIRPVYVRTSEGWEQIAHMGPQGAPGTPGATGATGATGPTGAAGVDGMPGFPPGLYQNNTWYGQPIVATSTYLPSEGVLFANLVVIPANFAIVALLFEVTIVGSTGATARLGVYRFNTALAGGYLGGVRDLDCGAFPATTVGQVEVPCALAAKATPWLAILALTTQGGATTKPTYRSVGNTPQVAPIGKQLLANAVNSIAYGAYIAAGVTAALPATFTSISEATTMPRILMRGTQS